MTQTPMPYKNVLILEDKISELLWVPKFARGTSSIYTFLVGLMITYRQAKTCGQILQ